MKLFVEFGKLIPPREGEFGDVHDQRVEDKPFQVSSF